MGFDTTTLAWQGLLRASYNSANSPKWPGTASAGGSGGRNADEATAFPANGLSQNSLVAARFDGVSNFLTASGVVSDYIGASGAAWTFEALVRWNTTAVDGGTITGDPCVFTDNGGNWGMSLTSAGCRLQQYDNGTPTQRTVLNTDVTAASGTLFLIQARFDGTNISVRINRGTWANTACTSFWSAVLPGSIFIGKSFNAAAFLDADIFEWKLIDFALSDAQLDADGDYIQVRYALSLGFPAYSPGNSFPFYAPRGLMSAGPVKHFVASPLTLAFLVSSQQHVDRGLQTPAATTSPMPMTVGPSRRFQGPVPRRTSMQPHVDVGFQAPAQASASMPLTAGPVRQFYGPIPDLASAQQHVDIGFSTPGSTVDAAPLTAGPMRGFMAAPVGITSMQTHVDLGQQSPAVTGSLPFTSGPMRSFPAAPTGVTSMQTHVDVGFQTPGATTHATPFTAGPMRGFVAAPTGTVSAQQHVDLGFQTPGVPMGLPFAAGPFEAYGAPFGSSAFGVFVPSGAMSGVAALTFGQSGSALGAAAAVGTGTITFGQSGNALGAASLVGTGAITLGQTGTVLGAASLAGTAHLTFGQSGSAKGAGSLVGTAQLTFAQTGSLKGAAALHGTAGIVFGATGTCLNLPIVIPDIVAHDAAVVWMLPRASASVFWPAHDAGAVQVLPRSSAVIYWAAHDSAVVVELPKNSATVRGIK